MDEQGSRLKRRTPSPSGSSPSFATWSARCARTSRWTWRARRDRFFRRSRSHAARIRAGPERDVIDVILVDDQTLVRQGIRSLLALSADIRVVAEASDGEAAVSVIVATRADVVLLDVRMP